MRALLTGFGHFETTVNNPTARIVAHFANRGALGYDLVTRVLPVSYARAAEEVRALLLGEQFDAALLLGVAGRASAIHVERLARRPDGTGRLDADGQSAPTVVDHPDSYGATAGCDGVLAAIEAAGLSAELSEDAGGYVCNSTYYAALSTIAQAGLATHCLFLHVPPDADTYAAPMDRPTLSLDAQITAVTAVLKTITGMVRG